MDDTERWVPLEFERYIRLLEKIQREPKWKTTRQLATELNDEGFDTSLRQVQRILEYFGPRFGVSATRLPYGRGKPQAWAWPKQRKSLPFPTMDAPAALTYQIAAELLAPLLPTAFLDELEPEFKRAHRVLGLASTRAASLPRKLQVLPRGTGRLPAQIRPQVLHAVEQLDRAGFAAVIVQPGGAHEAVPVARAPRAAEGEAEGVVDFFKDQLVAGNVLVKVTGNLKVRRSTG